MELVKQENQFIAEIKERIRKAQYDTLKVVNTELIETQRKVIEERSRS